MSFRIVLSESVRKDIADIPVERRGPVWAHVTALAEDPRPPGMERLSGNYAGISRVRAGNYRIGYRIIEDTVKVLLIDDRRSFYKKLDRRL